MADLLKPTKGGFLGSFGCAEFIRKFLLGQGPHGSPAIDPETGAPQADIFYHYKMALMRATAVDRATRVEEKRARREHRPIEPGNIERLAERYLARMPYKSRGCRYHSFVTYFSTLQRLVGWNPAGKKSDQVSRTTIHQGRRASISGLQRPGERRARQAGETPVVFFTANTPLTGRRANSK